MTSSHAWARRGERAIGSVPTFVGFDDGDRGPGSGWRAGTAGTSPVPPISQAFQTYVDEVLVPELRPGDVVIFEQPQSPPRSARGGVDQAPQVPASCPCRRTVRTTTRSRSCGRSSKGNFVGSRPGCEMTCITLLERSWTMLTLQDILGWFNHSGVYATHA